MKKSILTLTALAAGLAWGCPASADDELEDRVARLEKLMKRLETKLDQLGGGKEEKEDVRVEKRLFHVPGDDEKGPHRMFLFRLEDDGEEKKDVIVPRFRHFAIPGDDPGFDALPFPGLRLLEMKADGAEVEIAVVIDGKRYEGTLRRSEKEGEGPRKFEKKIELRQRLEQAVEPRLERAREALERAREEFEKARGRAPADPLEAEIERVKDLLDRLLEAKEGRTEKKEKKERD